MHCTELSTPKLEWTSGIEYYKLPRLGLPWAFLMAPDATVRSWAVLAVVVENLIKNPFYSFVLFLTSPRLNYLQ